MNDEFKDLDELCERLEKLLHKVEKMKEKKQSTLQNETVRHIKERLRTLRRRRKS